MTANGWIQIAVFLALILAVTKPMGVFMARVFNRERTFLDPVLRPVERLLYRLTGVDETHEMRWTEYAAAMLLFSVVSMLLLYLIERVQLHLPFNPQKFAAVTCLSTWRGTRQPRSPPIPTGKPIRVRAR
jgi:potassium-transporting ATPase potassium-binding subunit